MITLAFYIVPNLIDDVLIIDTTNFPKIVRSSYTILGWKVVWR